MLEQKGVEYINCIEMKEEDFIIQNLFQILNSLSGLEKFSSNNHRFMSKDL